MDNSIAEVQRLQERYSAFTDEELQDVAEDANDLTDAARTVLQSEISRRGLHFSSPTNPRGASNGNENKFDSSDSNLVTVRRVWEREEANNVMRILHDADIPCYLGPENLEDANMFHSSFDDGVDIKVIEGTEQLAESVLRQTLPSEPNDDTGYVAQCPKCHSTEIVFQGLDDNSAAQSSSAENFNWSCDSCGYQWKDDGIEERS